VPHKKRHTLAFFCLYLLVSLSSVSLHAAHYVNHCQQQTFDKVIAIKHIIDGDTVITVNNEHIRLIGIDTPEINNRTGDNEIGAVAAKNYLRMLLVGVDTIGMILDEEKQDQYGRTLAHLYLTDGTNIQAKLLQTGLAVPFTYPPNLKYTVCYYRVSEQAEKQQQGLWGLSRYQAVNLEELSDNASGYRIINAKVQKIIDSEHSLKLHFNRDFIVSIGKSDLKFFQTMDINTTLGNQTQVRGELYQRDGKLWMTIRHPLDIKVLTPVYNN
jgi:micrococcal nuclease